jgi:hypothetical protein
VVVDEEAVWLCLLARPRPTLLLLQSPFHAHVQAARHENIDFCDMSVIIQRPLRGSRISSFYPIKTLPSLSSLDSAFQLQEYISLLIRLDVHDVDTIVSMPGKHDADKGDVNRVEVDEACWIYEQLRCVRMSVWGVLSC